MAWEFEVNKKEFMYEQGTIEEIVMTLDFNQLFDKMLLVSKGEIKVKTVIKELKSQLKLSKEDFDKFYYGKFPVWMHEYVLEIWSQYVGETLDKELLIMILDQDITDWEEVFCVETSIEMLLKGVDYIRDMKLLGDRHEALIAEKQKELDDLKYRNLVSSIRLSILEGKFNARE